MATRGKLISIWHFGCLLKKVPVGKLLSVIHIDSLGVLFVGCKKVNKLMSHVHYIIEYCWWQGWCKET